MSVVPIHQPHLGYAGLLMRAVDFFALGETRERYELVNGVVVMSPSVRPRHWMVVHEVLKQLDAFNAPLKKLDIFAEIDLHLDQVTVFRPDLCVYCRVENTPPSPIPERLVAPPSLILEVLSPGSKPLDLVTKRDAYERFQVPEYWTIDPDDGRVRAWSTQGGGDGIYMETPIIGDQLESTAIPGFRLDLHPIRIIGST
ncbi:MAG: Uma2 family endonuclease [Pyrinomonadaceae bacterium]|nr:Uma2 family endonuclease [Phycisphaerales bacterium]